MNNFKKPCPWVRGKTNLRGIQLTADQRQWLGEAMVAGTLTPTTASVRFNLTVPQLKKYAARVRKGGIFHNNVGRPPVLDEESKKAYVDLLTDNIYHNRTEDVNEFIQKLAVKTARARGIHELNTRKVSERSIRRLEAEQGTMRKNSEAVTVARQIATSDVRNAVTFGAMNAMMTEVTPPHLIINMDSTQFAVGYDTQKKTQVQFIGHVSGPLKALPSKAKHSSGLAYFIKVFITVTAFGHEGPPVYLVADDNMAEGEFDPHRVVGIGVGTEVGCVGYLVFCKSRSPPATFFKWYDNTILFDFIDVIRRTYDMEDTCAWYQLDGEINQVSGYEDPSVLESYRTRNIIVGKPSGSTTSITQAIDAGNVIKAAKGKLKVVKDDKVEENLYMIKTLKDVVKEHDKIVVMTKEVDEKSSGNRKKKKVCVSYSHTRMIALGVLRIQLALQNTHKPELIKHSFRITGIYPFSFPAILNNLKLEKALKLSNEEIDLCLQTLPVAVEKFKEKGYITDAEMDDLNLPNNMNTNKDSVVANRSRSTILTHQGFVEKEIVKAIAKKEKQKRVPKKKASKEEDNTTFFTTAKNWMSTFWK